MNKTELIASVAQKSDLTKKDAEKAVKAVFEAVSETLKKGDKVQIIGFGTFVKLAKAVIPATTKLSRFPHLKHRLSKQVSSSKTW